MFGKISLLCFKFLSMLNDPVTDLSFVTRIMNTINLILTPIFAITAAAGGIYAIILGVNMARADSAEAREEAKKRVIYCVIGMAVAVGLILLLQLFVYYLPIWIGESGEIFDIPD